MKRRSSELWFAVALVAFLACLAATGIVHHQYEQAELVYHKQLAHITFAPHTHVSEYLESALLRTHHLLLEQALLGGVTAAATGNVLLQVLRRRNARVAAVEATD